MGSAFEFVGMNPMCLADNANSALTREGEYFVFNSKFESGNIDLIIKVSNTNL